jgi:hypothetical protein
VGGEQAPAEAVDRRDPGPVCRLGHGGEPLVLLALRARRAPGELLAHPAAELVGRSLGEGEGEDALDADLLLDRGRAEAVDQHGGLAGAGAGAEEDVAVPRADRLRLLLGPLVHSSSSSSGPVNSSSGMPRSRRQIGW